jgi:hypothetical protein
MPQTAAPARPSAADSLDSAAGRIAEAIVSRPLRTHSDAELAIHTLLCHDHLPYYLFCISTFLSFSGLRCSVFVYDDGTLEEEDRVILEATVQGINVIAPVQYARQLSRQLYPHCHRFMTEHPLGRRLIGIAVMNTASRFIVLDSDVLFFKRPTDIVRWSSWPGIKSMFNRDSLRDESVCFGEQEFARFGGRAVPYFNAGLLCTSSSIIDLPVIEGILNYLYTAGYTGQWMWDQTIWAVLVSRHSYRPLPRSYHFQNRFSNDRRIDLTQLISKHYSEPRDIFFSEGVMYLLATGRF